MTDPLVVPCHVCSEPMARVETVGQTADGPAFDCYQCQVGGCGRKVVVVFEPAGGLSAPQQTFIEQEIARRGAFFPSDHTFGSGRGGGGRGRR